ncbi:MAG: DsbC family protein [Vitreoscilla sp.]|nr:DsbC family protein [Burkholderiales bacterium]MBP6337501.1 DsbC family protein [Vitreoscilla sp.]
MNATFQRTARLPLFSPLVAAALGCLLGLAGTGARADEAAIRKALAERMPNFPNIDEVTRTPIPGIYELRLGTEVIYSDETGQYLIQGSLLDTKTKTDLTKAREDKLSAIDFNSLPLKDALLIKQGTGLRKVAVFADPNCGYCKRLEKDLLTIKDVTIYTFLLPVLGPDSNAKSKDIWCAKDGAKVWRSWMVDGMAPPKSAEKCDAGVLERNLAMGRKYRVNGTPALVFEDGTRAPGAIPAAQIEKNLNNARKG